MWSPAEGPTVGPTSQMLVQAVVSRCPPAQLCDQKNPTLKGKAAGLLRLGHYDAPV